MNSIPSIPQGKKRFIGFYGDSLTRSQLDGLDPMNESRLHIQALIQNGRMGKDIAVNAGIDGATLLGNGYQHLPAVQKEIHAFKQQIPDGYQPVINIMLGTNDLTGGGDPFPGKVSVQQGSNIAIGDADTKFLNGDSFGSGEGNKAFQPGDSFKIENVNGPEITLPVKDVLNDHVLELAAPSSVTTSQQSYKKVVTPEKMYQQLKQYIQAWKQGIAHLTVLICTIPALRNKAGFLAIQRYNQLLRHGAPVKQGGNGDVGADMLVDIGALSMFKDRPAVDSPYYMKDGVHPNQQGITQYAKAIGNAILST